MLLRIDQWLDLLSSMPAYYPESSSSHQENQLRITCESGIKKAEVGMRESYPVPCTHRAHGYHLTEWCHHPALRVRMQSQRVSFPLCPLL